MIYLILHDMYVVYLNHFSEVGALLDCKHEPVSTEKCQLYSFAYFTCVFSRLKTEISRDSHNAAATLCE